jgi:hypothetical protein
MADIIGRIATPVTPSQSSSTGGKPHYKDSKTENGREVFTFRFAENHGRAGSPNRKTTWYDVRAVISREHAASLRVGQVVKICGRLDPEAYVKTELLEDEPVPNTWSKVAALLDEYGGLTTSNVLLTTSVVPCRLPTEKPENRPDHRAA